MSDTWPVTLPVTFPVTFPVKLDVTVAKVTLSVVPTDWPIDIEPELYVTPVPPER